jgi:large subunit ribosomal protein L1
MGKTRTVVVSETPQEPKSSAAKAKEVKKKRKQKKSLREEKGVRIPGLKGGERIVAVEAGPIIETEKEKTEPSAAEAKKKRPPKIRSKKYKDARAKIDKTKLYPLPEAIKLVKDTSYSSFDGTVELHLAVKKEGLSVNVILPHSAGKEKKIEIAKPSTIKKLEKGKIDFDVLLATAGMMPKLAPFAKVLGPKGLMPNAKNGTLIKDAKEAKKFSANTLTIRTERKAPLIHTNIGKVGQKDKELIENIEAIIDAVSKRQIVKAFLTSTMGPSVKIALSS